MRDMKYLSHKKSFNKTVSRSMLNGGTDEIPVDFTVLTELDNSGSSRYVVGGRVYFEGSVFGNGVNSFTYKGFFDDANYVEPSSSLRIIHG